MNIGARTRSISAAGRMHYHVGFIVRPWLLTVANDTAMGLFRRDLSAPDNCLPKTAENCSWPRILILDHAVNQGSCAPRKYNDVNNIYDY
jgi:hypothetical protein